MSEPVALAWTRNTLPRRRRGDGNEVASLTSFVGRDRDLGRVLGTLAAARLVTLTGPGGVGKTRIACEVLTAAARDFPDGVVFVDLQAVRSDDAVAQVVLDRVEPAADGSASATARLAEFLMDKALLLVLDNCEHVLAGSRALLAAVLARAGRVRVLTTSRERLAIAGEHVVAVEPLAVPPVPRGAAAPSLQRARESPAVRLLEQRAVAAAGTFELDADSVAHAVNVCRRLDGLPLAIELAAVRLRSMTLAELDARLDDRFLMLNRGDPTARSEHRTLAAMVQWSWDLCTASEQLLWARLSAFAGGAHLQAVLAVSEPDVSGEAEAVDLLDSLVGKSVVFVDQDGQGTRYRMLETIADFGRRRLAEYSDRAEVAVRHARFYRAFAARAANGFYSSRQLEWTRRLDDDRANLAVALDRLIETRAEGGRAAVEFAVSLRFHWMVRSVAEGDRALARALAGYEGSGPLLVQALLVRASLAAGTGDVAAMADHVATASKTAAGLADPAWRYRCEIARVVVDDLRGSVSSAAFDRALAASDLPADREFVVVNAIGHAFVLLNVGQVESSRAYLRLAGRLGEECGERWIRGWADTLTALGRWLVGDLGGAEAAARRGLEVYMEFGDARGMVGALRVLAGVAGAGGDARRAAVLSGAVAVGIRAIGERQLPYGPAVAAAFDDVERRVRTQLGAAEYEAARAEGAGLVSEASLRAFVLDVAAVPPAAVDREVRDHAPLTVREFEVAGLVARGMTNRAIAAELVVSLRTVDGHLERILAKLGFRSRAEVAVWVAKRHM